MRVYITSPQDRDAVVTILARNGYTVRQGKERKGKSYEKYVEYWKEGEDDRTAGTDRARQVDATALC